MNLYAISGLGADERVFRYLTLDHHIIPINWLSPKKNESIEEYAVRLSSIIDQTEPFGILGVSFGGLIAVEISKILKPKYTILISSVEIANNLPTIIQIIGKSKIIDFLPSWCFNPPRIIAHILFGTKNKALLNDILDDTDLTFAKWAISQLTTWKNQTRIENILKIRGTNDKLMPSKKGHNTVMVPNGAHFMIVDNANEVSQIINDFCSKY